MAQQQYNIITLCKISDIHAETEEAEPITAKVFEYKTKIDRAINPK